MKTVSKKDTYSDKLKYFRDENGKWVLPKDTVITDAGRAIVELEPDLTDETVDALLETDWEKLSPEDRVFVTTKTPEEIYNEIFLGNNETGIVHVAQCIQDNPDQPLAEMVARYADERRIPYLLGAIYIKSFLSKSSLFYYQVAETEYRRVKWTPTSYYVPPEIEVPPTKKKRRVRKQPLTAIPKAPSYKVYLCPLCNSPVKLLRCGKNGRLWHACCTDQKRTCVNYAGLAPVKTEKAAATAWNSYVKSVTNKPIWQTDTSIRFDEDIRETNEEVEPIE